MCRDVYSYEGWQSRMKNDALVNYISKIDFNNFEKRVTLRSTKEKTMTTEDMNTEKMKRLVGQRKSDDDVITTGNVYILGSPCRVERDEPTGLIRIHAPRGKVLVGNGWREHSHVFHTVSRAASAINGLFGVRLEKMTDQERETPEPKLVQSAPVKAAPVVQPSPKGTPPRLGGSVVVGKVRNALSATVQAALDKMHTVGAVITTINGGGFDGHYLIT